MTHPDGTLVKITLPLDPNDGTIREAISTRLPILPAEGDLIVWPDQIDGRETTVVVKSVKWYIDVDEFGNRIEEPYVYITVGRHKNIRIENSGPTVDELLRRQSPSVPDRQAEALRRKRQ